MFYISKTPYIDFLYRYDIIYLDSERIYLSIIEHSQSNIFHLMKTLKLLWVITAVISAVGSIMLTGLCWLMPELPFIHPLTNIMLKTMAVTSILPVMAFFMSLAYYGGYTDERERLSFTDLGIRILSVCMVLIFLGVFSIVMPIPFSMDMTTFRVDQLRVYAIVLSGIVGFMGALGIERSGVVT